MRVMGGVLARTGTADGENQSGPRWRVGMDQGREREKKMLGIGLSAARG